MFDQTGRTGRTVTRKISARLGRPLGAVSLLFALALCGSVCFGCGAGSKSWSTPSASPEAGPGSSVRSAEVTTREFSQVFTDMARALAPVPAYGLVELPAGCVVPELWWPVVEVESAEDYQGPITSNPQIYDAGGPYGEAQLVLEMGAGTVVLLQDFRGDLGNTTGETVGTVAGHTAILYEMNGGLLVQWSDEGKWYGVFARGLSPDEVVALSLEMERISFEETD